MIQIFIIFHKYIFDECYENIPPDILQKYFTFIAVNPNIPKQYTQNKYKIINEWDLSIYDKTFQERGYNENSAIYHVYANYLHKEYDYIGFFQYDMKFGDNIINCIEQNIQDGPKYFAFANDDFHFCSYTSWNEPNTLEYIMKNYEEFFNRHFSRNKRYPLLNSYVIPRNLYEKVIKWAIHLHDKLYPWCIQYPNRTHFGHIGSIYERVMAYSIGEENLPYIKVNVHHDHDYKRLSY
jgi:hypothetical protein